MHPSRTRRRTTALAATLVAAGAAALATGLGASSQAAAPAAEAAGTADWTMMVYAVGDTPSVPEPMVENLADLAQVPLGEDVNVVVLLDLPEADDPDAPTSQLPGVGAFSTAKLLRLEDGGYTELEDLGELSMGDPATLSDFVAEAAERFPARHYGFTFFDHGGGNTGGYVDSGPPVGQDLSVPELRSGLLEGMQRAGIDRFDVLNHAACLMANYEVTSALAPLAQWMGASEEIMIGYPLAPASLAPMAQGGTGEDVADAFVDGYVDFLDQVAAEPANQQYRDLAAMSVVDGDAVANLDRAIDSFSQVAVAAMPEIATAVARARGSALEYVIGFPGTEGQSEDLVDLGDFLKHLTGVPDEVAVARDAVSAALDRAVTLQATGQGTQQATGLSVYLPADPGRVDEAVLSDGTEPPGWAAFVEAFVDSARGSADSGGVRFTSNQAQVLQADASGIKIAGTLVGGSSAELASADTYVLTDVGGTSALGLVLPAYVDAGGPGQVQGVWDYSLTAITDGSTSVGASAVYQAQSGGLLGTMKAQYTRPGGEQTDVGIRVLLTSAGEIQSATVVDLSSGAGAAGLTLENGGTLRPYLLVPGSSGYQTTLSSQTIRISDRLEIAWQRLPRDQRFDMALLVSDAAGHTDFAAVSGRAQ